MVVRIARGIPERNTFGIQSGTAISGLFKDCKAAFLFYPVIMENVEDSVVPVLIYTALLTASIIAVLVLLPLIVVGRIILGNMVMFPGLFVILLIFFFVTGYIYRILLERRLDTSYISYVYVVGLSFIHLPILLLGAPYSIYTVLMIVSSIISQFIIESSMLKDYEFMSRRSRFAFGIVALIFQFSLAIFMFRITTVMVYRPKL